MATPSGPDFIPMAESSFAPVTDFSSEIYAAYKNAPMVDAQRLHEDGVIQPVDPTELDRAAEAGLASCRDLPDDAVITLGDTAQYELNTVSTDSPEAYWILIRQLFNLPLNSFGDEQVEEQARAWYEHEMGHAKAVHEVDPSIRLKYTVSLFKYDKGGGETGYWSRPSVVPVGSVRKADLAYILVAPESHSTGHEGLLKALGFASSEDVIARRAALPPLHTDSPVVE